jgi:hypothetical protein
LTTQIKVQKEGGKTDINREKYFNEIHSFRNSKIYIKPIHGRSMVFLTLEESSRLSSFIEPSKVMSGDAPIAVFKKEVLNLCKFLTNGILTSNKYLKTNASILHCDHI